jgi:hypothetical protein
LETEDTRVRGNRRQLAEVGLDLWREGNSCRRLRVSPLGGGDGVAAIMAAGAGVADCELSGF